MHAALYARTSTKDGRQDIALQLTPLRDWARNKGHSVVEYQDRARASDLAGRKAWKRLLEDCRAGQVDVVAVWKLDRAFRSVSHCFRVLDELTASGVGFTAITQQIDTTSLTGRLTLAIVATMAELESQLLSERIKEGLKNARLKGKRLGRPPVTERPGFAREWHAVKAELDAGALSKRAAARKLGIAPPTLDDLLVGVSKRRRKQALPKGPNAESPSAERDFPPTLSES